MSYLFEKLLDIYAYLCANFTKSMPFLKSSSLPNFLIHFYLINRDNNSLTIFVFNFINPCLHLLREFLLVTSYTMTATEVFECNLR